MSEQMQSIESNVEVGAVDADAVDAGVVDARNP
jgi:hypothetical protein